MASEDHFFLGLSVTTQLAKEVPPADLRAGLHHVRLRPAVSGTAWASCPGCTLPCNRMRWQPEAKQHMFIIFYFPFFFSLMLFLFALRNTWPHSHMPGSALTWSRRSFGRLINLASPQTTAGFVAYLFWLSFSHFSKVHAWLESVCNLNGTCFNLNISKLMWVYLVRVKWWSSWHIKWLDPDSQCSLLRVYLICVGSSLCFISFVSEKFVDQNRWFIFFLIPPYASGRLNVNGVFILAGENQGKLWLDLSLDSAGNKSLGF